MTPISGISGRRRSCVNEKNRSSGAPVRNVCVRSIQINEPANLISSTKIVININARRVYFAIMQIVGVL